ncbi:MAG: hypothetical protein ACXABY_30185 [Candidatus Thorarchaeota archaeon]|jgi:hypothetical protein
MVQVPQSNADVSYFLSSTTRPHHGKASPIQKGLIPSRQSGSADLCEEGVGFGVPLLQYRRDFYFPGKATASHEGIVSEKIAWKQFDINLVERHQAKRSEAIQAFSWIYQRIYNRLYKSIHGRKLLGLLEVRTRQTGERAGRSPSKFFRVKSRGEIKTSYEIDTEKNWMIVNLEFSDVAKPSLQHIYVSNELGGTYFDHYADSSGLKLEGTAISGWDKITADWAAFCAPELNLGYIVEIPEDVTAFRGREIIGPDICWSGIIFMLDASIESLQYRVKLGPCENGGGLMWR